MINSKAISSDTTHTFPSWAPQSWCAVRAGEFLAFLLPQGRKGGFSPNPPASSCSLNSYFFTAASPGLPTNKTSYKVFDSQILYFIKYVSATNRLHYVMMLTCAAWPPCDWGTMIV
jgi:hypothetical protein